jgi:hypothetical protein
MRELLANARQFASGDHEQLSGLICEYVVHLVEWLECSAPPLPGPEAPGPHSGLQCDALRKIGPGA